MFATKLLVFFISNLEERAEVERDRLGKKGQRWIEHIEILLHNWKDKIYMYRYSTHIILSQK